jgi:hypothetical protein
MSKGHHQYHQRGMSCVNEVSPLCDPRNTTHEGTGNGARSQLNQSIAKANVRKVLKMAKNSLATGMDKCP